jgi:plastocyanin domain-containing protein
MNKLTNMFVVAALFCSLILTSACGSSVQSENIKNETSESETPNKTTRVTISKRGYEPESIAVKKGQPVKLIFFREDGENCGEEVVFPSLNIKRKLQVGATATVEFTPQESSEIGFTCGMNMLRGKVIVSD